MIIIIKEDTFVRIPNLGASSDIGGEVEDVLESLKERRIERSINGRLMKEGKDLRWILFIN